MEKRLPLIPSARPAMRVRPGTALRSLDRPSSLGRVEQSPSAPDKRFTLLRPAGTVSPLPAASLLFAPGERPGVDKLRALAAAAEPSFLISFDPELGAASSPKERWVEAVANGFTFDLQGLAPGAPQPEPPGTHRFGLPAEFEKGALEGITLHPGCQAGSAARTVPVLRSLAQLTAVLAGLPGVRAVAWHSARAWSGPDHFRSSVFRWMQGGAFPALGLTALAPAPEGGWESEGLALFTGQELRLSPELSRDRAAGARLALRLLHWLVEHGRLEAPLEVPGPSGESLRLQPSANRRVIHVSRG